MPFSTWELPEHAMAWCLASAGVQPEDLDAIVFYERPTLKFDRIVTTGLRAFPRSWRAFPKAMKNMLGEKLWMRGVIASQLGVPGLITDRPIRELKYYWSTMGEYRGGDALVGRTGYTGEDGYEIYVQRPHAAELWSALMAAGERVGRLREQVWPDGSERKRVADHDASLHARRDRPLGDVA